MPSKASKWCGVAVALAGSWLTHDASAATVPAGFVDEQVASGLVTPTKMAFAPDGRLLVAQQSGTLRVIKNGTLLATPFLSLSVSSSGERGLLGVAFDPNFASNQYVYVYYTTATAPIHNRVSRFTATGDVASAGSELVLLDLETLNASNHNGGALQFGPDGKLYVGVGENGVGTNAQTLSNRLGKLLRINSDGSIPTDNPFFASATGVNRAIWALGLRNPYSFAFKPGGTRLLINDVGQDLWEEINDGVSGSNYGWPTTEGATSNSAFRSPLYAYPHEGGACAIVGAAFYNPANVAFPASYVGDFFFGDYCSGSLRSYDTTTGAVSDFAIGLNTPVDIAIGADGAVYYLTQGASSVRRIRATAAPVAAAVPASNGFSGLALSCALGLIGVLLAERRRRVVTARA